MSKIAAAQDPLLTPRQRVGAVKEEFDPMNQAHRDAVLRYIETSNWNTNIDIYGSHNVPYDAMKKMAYYACKYLRVK